MYCCIPPDSYLHTHFSPTRRRMMLSDEHTVRLQAKQCTQTHLAHAYVPAHITKCPTTHSRTCYVAQYYRQENRPCSSLHPPFLNTRKHCAWHCSFFVYIQHISHDRKSGCWQSKIYGKRVERKKNVRYAESLQLTVVIRISKKSEVTLDTKQFPTLIRICIQTTDTRKHLSHTAHHGGGVLYSISDASHHTPQTHTIRQ